ncbi:hypothetical protein AXF42_Ash004507 [Apostasia shenzhenica]|uniref:Uncharacterized protein n=1 Tax=Apostasia shenzhenica TaxID=1088818 RepID=A0A2I0BGV3_9ASPA|nr:hypothetical protein AXF42_Ash004507 [Apostasia shenzhenica]
MTSRLLRQVRHDAPQRALFTEPGGGRSTSDLGRASFAKPERGRAYLAEPDTTCTSLGSPCFTQLATSNGFRELLGTPTTMLRHLRVGRQLLLLLLLL